MHCGCAAAWCYPEPVHGRENLKDHVTFATGKGISVAQVQRSTGKLRKGVAPKVALGAGSKGKA
eukprot:SAG31_NODE_25823_length_453_cov_0.884181_1_plen_63_part_10